MSNSQIQVLITDVGGVLGTNGWDTALRARVAAQFGYDLAETDSRHHLIFDAFELGKFSFEEYLNRTIFFQPRPFTVEQVRDFAYSQSVVNQEMLDFFLRVKQAHDLKMGILSNEGSGLTEYRVQKFGLRNLADFLIFSCKVGLRKPDRDIWRLALNLCQYQPQEIIYIDDRLFFVEMAAEMGFHAFQHIDLAQTQQNLAGLGLSLSA